jgi:hypothetical protein
MEPSLSIRLGSEIRIQARSLRLANPDWAGHPDALYVERLDVSVLASSLWRPPLVITSLEAGGLRLWLGTSDAGVSNFSFSPDAQPSTSDRDGRVLPVFQHIALQDLRLDWLQAGHDQPQTLIVSTLAQELLADNMLELALQGLANSQPLAFNGILGPFDALLQGRNVALKGSGQLGGLAVQGHALIDDLTAPRYPEFDLQVRGADFAPLAALLGRPAPGEGPYTLQVSGQRIDDRLQLQLSGDIGSLSVTAEGHNAGVADFSQLDFAVAARQPRFPAWQDSQAQIHVTGPDVAEFRRLVGFNGRAEGAFELHLELTPGANDSSVVKGSARTALVQAALDKPAAAAERPAYGEAPVPAGGAA